MHRRALVLCRDVKISQAVTRFIEQVAEPVRIYLQHADHQIGLLMQDEPVFPDPGDLPARLQVIQQSPEFGSLVELYLELFGELGFIKRLVTRRSEKFE